MNPPKDPILAAILSVLMPGLGQFYCHQWVRGCLFLAGTFFLVMLAGPLGILVWVWGIFDAYRIAKSLQGYAYTGEGPVIELNRLRLPSVDLRKALPFIGIPLGVVALLLLVAVIVTLRSGLWDSGGSSEEAIRQLIEKIENYKSETGSYPDSLQALIDPTDPIEKKQILDRWGNLYVYRAGEKGFELFSAGKDGQPGTADDVQHRP
ncbi:MAG: type II secretion system protein GspG [Candidatus Binatia bacterium]